ncbi:MAG: LamG domain-containing protein [Patulibacter minatonensis]
MAARRAAILGMAFGALAGVGVLAGAAQAAAPLVGQWSLDGAYEDGASSATPDSSGNGLHLRAPAGSIRVGAASARFGPAGLLPANGSVLRVDSPVLAPANVTLLAWVRQSGAAPVLRYLAGRGDDGPGTCLGSSYALYTGYAGFEGLHFYVRQATPGFPEGLPTPKIPDAAWADGRWHLVAGTFDGARSRLFVDGSLAAESEPAKAGIQYALGGGTSFFVDGYPQAPCGASDFPGSLDDVRVYDRALTQPELARLAAATGPGAPELITDASLIKGVPPEPTPVPAPAPTPAPAARPVGNQAIASAVSQGLGLGGVSKQAPLAAVVQQLAKVQSAALAVLGAGAAKSSVAPPARSELSQAEQKRLRPNDGLQERLGAAKYGLTVQVPSDRVGDVVVAAVTLQLERAQAGGRAITQQIVLPPASGVAEAAASGKAGAAKGPVATIPIPVDQAAQAALGKADVAKATIAVQGAKVDELSEMSELEQLRLQQIVERRSKAMETLSNLVRKISDTEQTIIANMRGGETPSERKENRVLEAKKNDLAELASKLETQRDEATVKLNQAAQAATQQMLAGLVAFGAQAVSAATGAPVPGVSTKLPMAVGAVKACGPKCPYAVAEAASR